jgi:hypothetical protein
VGLLVFAVLAFTALFVLCVLGSVLSVVGWLVFLPLRLLGFLFRGAAALLVLPLILVFGVGATVVFGFGVLLFLVPALPLVVLVGLVWWLVKRGRHPTPSAT